MTTWPAATVPVFPAGYGALPSDFDTWVQDNFSFLAGGVVFRAHRAAAQALGAGDTLLGFDTVDEDPYSGWSGSPSYAWNAPVTGLYQVTVTFAVTAASNWLEAVVALSGTRIIGAQNGASSTGGASGCGGMVTVPMAGGQDSVQGIAYCANAESTLTTPGSWATVEIALVSQ